MQARRWLPTRGRRRSGPLAAAIAALMPGVLAGCGSPSTRASSSTSRVTTTVPVTAATTTTTTTTVPVTVPPTTTIPPLQEDPGWTVESRTASALVVDVRSLDAADGHHVSLARFRAGAVRLDLHAGSTDPPTFGVTLQPSAQSAVSAAERPLLLGAFNGGFKTSSGSGGVEIGGQIVRALVPGLASVVIDANGIASIGQWGRDVPKAGSTVVSVRQNLRLLVDGGQASPSVGVISAWGATLGGGSAVARSALGEDAAGNLIYAGSISALPSDLAAALVTAGAVSALELDINPQWVQLDLAATPGGTLTAAVPGQNRPGTQYLTGWSRDFFAVLAV